MIDSRDPIIVADAGPLMRLAAAGLLDGVRVTNRKIVIADMVEYEVCHKKPDAPYAKEILAWIERMGEAIERAETGEGLAIGALRQRVAADPAPSNQAVLKKRLQHAGERAVRDYVEALEPRDVDHVLVLFEDRDILPLLLAARVPLQAMSTQAFGELMERRGYNAGAVAALEAMAAAKTFTLAPAEVTSRGPFGAMVDDDEAG